MPVFFWHTPCSLGPPHRFNWVSQNDFSLGVCLNTFRLITVLSICLFIKVSQVFGEDAPKTPTASLAPAPATATVTTTTAPNQTVKITETPVVTTANGVRVETRTIETQPPAPEKVKSEPVDSTRHFQGSSETKIENHITIDGRGLAYGALPVAAAPAVVSAVASEVLTSRPLSLTPVAGVTGYQGAWYNHISNRGTVGLILDIPLISILSLEAEGQYGRFNLSYSNYSHYFSQYTGGANAKLTLGQGLLQPYVGAGMMAVYYEGMTADTYSNVSNRVIGAAQAVAGIDLKLFGGIAVGARGEMLHPMTNLPQVMGGLGSQDAAAMRANFYRVLGTVRVSF